MKAATVDESNPKRDAECGSLVLESALILPLVLIVLGIFLAQIRAVQKEVLVAYALDKTAEEIALIVPLADAIVAGVASDKITEVFDQVLPVGALRELTLDLAADFGSSFLLGPLVSSRFSYWLDEASVLASFGLPPFAHALALDFRADDYQLILTLQYDLTTPFRKDLREIRAFVPLWTTGKPFKENPEEKGDGDADPIWELSNFERGARFREKYGANLPFSYPRVAIWDGGQVTSIKSVDLTAPSYTNELVLRNHLEGLILNVALFRGAAQGGVVISQSEITERRLLLIVPTNLPAHTDQAFFNRLDEFAGMNGVVLDVRKDGRSARYDLPTP